MKAMGETQRRLHRKKILLAILIVFSMALVLSCVMLILRYWEDQHGHFTKEPNSVNVGNSDNKSVIWYNGQRYALRDGIETVLLIGVDTFERDGEDSYNERSDFLMLLILDSKAETCMALHIDRDTMADIPVLGSASQVIGTMRGQLALAHTYGSGGHDSCRNTVNAVSKFLYNTPIDHYLSTTMSGVQILNDEVGGVTVTVIDDMTLVDPSFVLGEEVTLHGEQALKYVRSRSGLENSTNRRRMERQRQYIDALYQKFMQCIIGDDGFSTSALMKMSNYIVSDYSLARLADLLNTSSRYEFIGIDIIDGESVVGEKFMEFYPDEVAMQKLIIDLFYELQDDAA